MYNCKIYIVFKEKAYGVRVSEILKILRFIKGGKMIMYKILVTQAIHPDGMRLLESKANVRVLSAIKQDIFKKEAHDKDAIIIRLGGINADVIENCPNLKVIAKHGVGLDGIDVSTATQRKIPVIFAPGGNINSVAEHTIAMMLSITRDLRRADNATRKGDFSFRNHSKMVDLKNKILGIIGYGRIGKEVAKKCKSAFNMKIMVYDPYIENKEEFEVEFVDNLCELFKIVDIVSLHIPSTDKNKGLVDYRFLKLLGKKGYLINCARGDLINQIDLTKALKNNIIAGAAIDVFKEEPPDFKEDLFSCDNILFSPHMAALSEESVKNVSLMVAKGVIDVLEGKIPKNIANREELNIQDI